MAVYTTIDNPEDYIIAHNYSGNDSTNNQTSLGMTPDLVWVKSRNTGSPTQHYIVDKVRGDEEYIISNSTAAEATDSNTFALVSGGFNLDGGNGWTNLSGRTYVAWNWKAGGAGSSNTDGTITSTVSADTTAGFSIVKWTGTASAGTIGHGLGVAPKVVLVKRYSTAGGGWLMQHGDLTGATYVIKLNTTGAEGDDGANFNSTFPTSSVFSVYDSNNTNASGADHIAYCFAEKQGYSKFGSYTGNGNADGAFVYTGFRPAFVMTKGSDVVDNWWMFDNKREGYNDDNAALYPNLQNAEAAPGWIDLLSNGFKMRNDDVAGNGDGSTYIYMAFAHSPFVNSEGVPTNAR